MAHIPDGVLSLPVVAGGWAVAATAVAVALRKLDDQSIPRTAILSATFFVASLISIPVGPSSVHLLLAGLMGLTIGILTIPAVLVGLLLQTLLFGIGGLSTLGINTINIALPGVVLGALFAPVIARSEPSRAVLWGGLCGALSAALTGGGVVLALMLSASAYLPAAKIIMTTYLPLMAGEAVITGFAIGFLKRVKPDLLSGFGSPAARRETGP